MEGSLRNADVLALINSRVPERLKEIDALLIKLNTESDDLLMERAKLKDVMCVLAPTPAVAPEPEPEPEPEPKSWVAKKKKPLVRFAPPAP